MKLPSAGTLLSALLLAVLCGCGSGGGGETPLFTETLTSVVPLEGTSAGGTQVTLTGSRFLSPSQPILDIFFGETLVEEDDWEIVDDTTIVVIAPPGDLGSTIITLWGNNPDQPLLTGGYRYVALTLYVAGGVQASVPSLFRVDLDSKFVGVVGPIGFPVTSLAARPDGAIFGVEDDPQRRLIQIDAQTGQGTPVVLLRDDLNQPVDILDLTFLGSRLMGRTATGDVVDIDIALGEVTFLPPLAGPAPGPGLCAFGNDLVYLTGSIGQPIHTWGPISGALLEGPVLMSGTFTTIDALEYLDQMAFAVSHDPGTNASALVMVDPFSGAVSHFVDLPDGMTAVARDL